MGQVAQRCRPLLEEEFNVMPSREEIREGIAILLYKMSTSPFKAKGWIKLTDGQKQPYLKNADFMVMMLADKGVVIKVDKPFRIGESVNADGLVAVESLIET